MKDNLENGIKEVLVSEEELRAKVAELGEILTNEYRGKNPLVVCILKGAVLFISDIIRQMPISLDIDFLAISSYDDGTTSSGVVRILKDLNTPVEGRDILIVEDILDTGRTLDYIIRLLGERKPNSIKICSLLVKPSREEIHVNVDYVGFTMPNEFVVGYGLDYAGKYRNLPYIGVLKPEIYENDSE